MSKSTASVFESSESVFESGARGLVKCKRV